MDNQTMNHGSLFSGIGGFDLAAQWMGWDNIFHCEWNPFGQKILKHYWPNSISYEDITKTDFTIHRGSIDILTGGFPCQPYSMAGKRKGKEDERHLWPEMLRAIREIQPRWVVGENVRGLINWSDGMVFDEVQTDLEDAGYEVMPFLLPACAVNAPHRRDRIWFVAYCKNNRHTSTKRIDEWGKYKQNNGDKIRTPFNTNGNEWNVTDTSGIRRNNGSDNRQKRYIQTNFWSSQKNQSEWDGWKCGIGKIGTTAYDTDSDGFYTGNSQHEINASKGRLDALGDISKSDVDGDVTNPNGFKREWGKFNGGTGKTGSTERKSGQFSRSVCSQWEKFPTQPPVCGGDDGLPTQLDGITFSKWRNESIKGYGNAIVPQVVLQIFKAIKQYEDHE